MTHVWWQAFNTERINIALEHQELLSIFFPGFLRSVLPIDAERRALGEEAFERINR